MTPKMTAGMKIRNRSKAPQLEIEFQLMKRFNRINSGVKRKKRFMPQAAPPSIK